MACRIQARFEARHKKCQMLGSQAKDVTSGAENNPPTHTHWSNLRSQKYVATIGHKGSYIHKGYANRTSATKSTEINLKKLICGSRKTYFVGFLSSGRFPIEIKPQIKCNNI